jgi:Ca2+-binding RTX toxin-like protein
LTAGQTYEFALFFAERHTVQSNLGMTTNIEFTPVAPLDCDAVDAVDDSAIIGTATTTLDVTNNDSGFTSIFSFTQPSNGVIAIVGSSLTYTPNPGFVGTDQFRYTIINANTGDTDSAIVSLVVTSGNVNGLFCEKPISAYSKVIIGTNANDNLVGTHGDDLIIGLGGNDKLIGLKGNDCLIGDTGNDILIGGPGDDYLLGGSGNDKLEGNHGNDKLYGQDGDDKIEGGDGNDYIDGGNHIQGDQCKGGSGTNTIVNCERHNSKDDD